jgi:hypothetical protein
MTQYTGQITVIIESDNSQSAESDLRAIARSIEDAHEAVVFADHNGDVENYEELEAECLESLESGPPLPTRFDEYEVHGVREFDDGNGKYCEQVPDDEAIFWSLYGHIPGQGVDCIGNFKTREFAEEVYARITGRRYGQGRSSARKGG